MKLLSDACEYGLRSATWLAQRPGAAYTAKEIAEGTRATPGYLTKVLQHMNRAGIVSARRGRQGGFELIRSPDDITVLDIINAVDPYERIRFCPLGIESHGAALCPLHQRLDDAVSALEKTFAGITIAQLLAEPTTSVALCDGLIDLGTPDPRERE